MKLVDITGKRFNRLTVIERAGSDKNGEATWRCLCDCGNETVVRGSRLRRGEIRSCGCLGDETRVKNGHKRMPVGHGQSRSRLYGVWHAMKARCYQQSHPHFKDYGKRGICVCDEWRDSFETFAEWANANGYDENAAKGYCTLDRIDPNGDYSPTNCRFADMAVQQNNRRDRDKSVEVVQGKDGIYHLSPNCGRKVEA